MLLQNLRLDISRLFSIPLTVSVVLSSNLPFPSSAALSHHHHRLFASQSTMSYPLSQSQSPPPPVAKKVEHVMELFGDVSIDNYYWLRDDSRSDPDVLSYLRQENAYTDSLMSGTCESSYSYPYPFHCLLIIIIIFEFCFYVVNTFL